MKKTMQMTKDEISNDDHFGRRRAVGRYEKFR